MSYESIILGEVNYGGAPTAYWPLTESSGAVAVDAAVGYDGAITGNITLNQTPGPINRGDGWPVFGGSDGIVTIAGTDLVGNGNVTVECWIKVSGVGGGGQGRILECSTTATRLLTVTDGAGGYAVRWYHTGSTYGATAGGLAFGTLYHLVATATSGGVTNFYINGVLSGDADQAIGTAAGTYTGIGNRADLARAFNGYLGQLAIYPYVMGLDRIVHHYLCGINGVADKKLLLGV